MRQRIDHLDSIRALAIFLVIGFHYFSRWTSPRSATNLYPFGDFLASNPIISHGHFGVELFFIVSGFVISMTLRRCKNPYEFVVKRLSRLLPPMIFCSIVTFLLLTLVIPVPELTPKWMGFIPSWTFTSPFFWRWLDPDIAYIDQAYWTLFVEVRFYFWACFIYFLAPRRFDEMFLAFSALVIFLHLVTLATGNSSSTRLVNLIFFARFIPWFTAGILFFRFFDGRSRREDIYLIAGIMIYLATYYVWRAQPLENHIMVITFVIFNFTLFTAFVTNPNFHIPGGRILQLIGLASYSLYLLHQKIGVALITRIDSQLPLWVQITLTLAIIAGIITAALLTFRLVEQPAKRAMLGALFYNKNRFT